MSRLGLLRTTAACKQIGRSKATILRWIKQKLIEDVEERDDNNDRVWTKDDIQRFIAFKNTMDNAKFEKGRAANG